MALPQWSVGPRSASDFLPAIIEAGYQGAQVFLPTHAAGAKAAGLADVSGIGTLRHIDEVDAVIGMWSGSVVSSLTLHLGTGFESSIEALKLVERTLTSASQFNVRVLIETHRGTLFQDPARTLSLIEQFPELRFTADLSHWYTGVEMVYGDFDSKLRAIRPVFERCQMIHGRISDPGCIQVAVDGVLDPSAHVEHFRRMWRCVLDQCQVGGAESMPFVVELLPAAAHYARTVDRGSGPEEEVDRWTQANVLWEIFEGLETTS